MRKSRPIVEYSDSPCVDLKSTDLRRLQNLRSLHVGRESVGQSVSRPTSRPTWMRRRLDSSAACQAIFILHSNLWPASFVHIECLAGLSG